MGVNKDELERLIEKSGVGGKAAKKLRAANTESESGVRSGVRGHGAAAPTTRSAGQL